jgi:hypothetical protein
MLIIVLLTLLFSTEISAAASDVILPSHTGAFFYADVLSNDQFKNDNPAYHSVQMLLGFDDEESYTFALNSEIGAI